MRVSGVFIVLLIAAQSAIAEPMGECHQYRDGPVGVREDVAERLFIAQLQADLHAAKLEHFQIEPSFSASRRALPTDDQLKAAFEADTLAWRHACRSPQVVAFDRSLTRIASAAEQARKADLQK